MLKQTQLSDYFKVTGRSPGDGKRKSTTKSIVLSTPSPAKKAKQSRQRSQTPLNTSQDNIQASPSSKLTRTLTPCRIATEVQRNLHAALQQHQQTSQCLPLESIYRNCSFTFDLSQLEITSANENYANIHPPDDKHGACLFRLLINVFQLPENCIYFSQNDLQMIQDILTLTPTSLTILSRFLKWKTGWHRLTKASNLCGFPIESTHINELHQRQLLECDLNDDIATILDFLQLDELRAVAKSLKVSAAGAKTKIIEQLTKISTQKRSIFPGAPTPAESLRKYVTKQLGNCLKVSDKTWDLIQRIATLHYPNHEADATITDLFRTFMDVHYRTRNYPTIMSPRLPIFRDRKEFSEFTQSRGMLRDVLSAIAAKNWTFVKKIALEAHEKFVKNHLNIDKVENTSLPRHLTLFRASYVYSKLIFKSIEAFKKKESPDYDTARRLLTTLIDQKALAGRAYAELALILSKDGKNCDIIADLVAKALTTDLNKHEIAELLERARKLAARRTGISAEKRQLMMQLIDEREGEFVCTVKENNVTAEMMSHELRGATKSTWRLDGNGGESVYGAVEDVAMDYYLKKQGYTKAIHAEGRLPVTIFACLFWNEIYTIDIAGANVSDYQIAPMDLWGREFMENRRAVIEERMAFVRSIDVETLSEIVYSNYLDYEHYDSLISTSLLAGREEDLKEIIVCLGTEAILGICETLIQSYRQMSAGFPDLIVWNADEGTCRIVEVKGPGDSLSVKQKLWIKRLQELQVDTEVCLVKTK